MTAMQRSFRSRGGLPWWWWRHHADRRARGEDGGVPVDPLDAIFGAISGWYPVTLANTFTDTAATVPCTADGNLVAAWVPTKGSLPMFVQATSGSRPVLKDAGSGRWRIDFASGKSMSTAATLTVAVENLMAVAISRTADGGSSLIRTGTAIVSAHYMTEVTTGRISGSYRLSAGTIYGATPVGGTFPLATQFVASSKLSSALIDMAKDLATPVTAAAVTGSDAAESAVITPTGGVSYWGAAIHRAAVISAADRAQIVTALAALQGRII